MWFFHTLWCKERCMGIIMEAIRKKAVVIGGDHQNTLGIIRSLGEAGLDVSAVITEKKYSFVSKSKYLKKYWLVEEDEDAILQILLSAFADEKEKIVVIPGSDFAQMFLDRNFDQLTSVFIFPNIQNKAGEVCYYMNKLNCNRLAAEAGLNVPYTVQLNLAECTAEELISAHCFPFPVILKSTGGDENSAKSITVVENEAELRIALRRLQEKKRSSVLLQEYLDIEEEFGAVGCVFFHSKEIMLPGMIRKIRFSKVSKTTYGKIVPHVEVIDRNAIFSFLRKLGFVGIFDLELMICNQKLYFIELNFRNGAYGYAYTKAGVNFPLLWLSEALGGKMDSVSDSYFSKDFYFMYEMADVKTVGKKVSLFKWIRQFLSADAKMVMSWKDFKPFYYKVLYQARGKKC